MSMQEDGPEFPNDGTSLLQRWQAGDQAALERLRLLFDAVREGRFDPLFKEPVLPDSVCVTTSLHLLTLPILSQIYGLASVDFYKGDPERYVRATLMTQRLLGIHKLTLGWPVYAFGAECLGQSMVYPSKHVPGADPTEPLVDRASWRGLDTPGLDKGIPRIIEEMLTCFADLTGLEPVAHLPAPYSLAADIFGQEALISALLEAPDFVDEFLDHLRQQVLVPWIERLVSRIPKAWIELSDATGSPMFIGPRLFMEVAARPVLRLIGDNRWGDRVFVANYRGDHLVQTDSGGRRRRSASRRGKESKREAQRTKSNEDALAELMDVKLKLCPDFIIKLDADHLPVSFYENLAIQRGKPLYLGIGATRIDRNTITDREAAKRELEAVATEYTQAIRTVSDAIARNGHARLDLAWPGDIYIEDINSESDLGLVKTIVETVATHGRASRQ